MDRQWNQKAKTSGGSKSYLLRLIHKIVTSLQGNTHPKDSGKSCYFPSPSSSPGSTGRQ